ncbi:hypothetical protein I6F36_26880 [Bradyrhizobium sp. BRP19]|uniref:hypothetical protein n=1 Tax=Bradyrhizobium sp. BRP19 TaxID=2793823 RepID=UPI001CD4D860|nr:hypothetical protein [Bradyrhizobium sp. BRP19]MCA1550460.1 hypothetical protein [Bradyrhizobium sp. BRP19]
MADIDHSRSVAAGSIKRSLETIIGIPGAVRNPQFAYCIQFVRYAFVLRHIRRLFEHRVRLGMARMSCKQEASRAAKIRNEPGAKVAQAQEDGPA